MGLVPEVMISPETLNIWLREGYGVDTFGYYRLVILDVDSREGYRRGHIPGAFLLEDSSVDLWAARSNGITSIPFQVVTKAQMDKIIRRANIDTDAVIVITGSKMTSVSRAYFNFRYWGFPRQQLKVMNGTSSTYAAAGFNLQTEIPPAPEPCRYDLCSSQSPSSFSAVRASFEEMVSQAEDNRAETVIIDIRSPAEYNGTPGSTLLNKERNEYAVFEGHVKKAINLDYRTLLVGQNVVNPLLPQDDLKRIMNRLRGDDKKISIVYGSNGLEGSVAFLALDAVLNRPVKLYDGGWRQWGQMAGNTTENGGMLQDDSPWRTDIAARSEAITYNKPHGFSPAGEDSYNSYAKHGNAINRTDLDVCGKTGAKLKTAPAAPGY